MPRGGTLLPASAQTFSRAAAARGIGIDIVVTAEPARTAEEAARAYGCGIGQIVKTLINMGRGRAVLEGRPLTSGGHSMTAL